MGIRNVGAGILNKTDQVYVRHALSTGKGLGSKKNAKKSHVLKGAGFVCLLSLESNIW